MSATGQDTGAPEGAPEPTETAAPETSTAAPDGGLDRLYQRMDAMATQQQQFMQQVTERLTPEEQEEAEEDFDFYDETGDLTEEGAQALIRDLVSQQVQEQLAPREHARQVELRDDAFEQLRDEYPELQDQDVADRVLRRSIEWATRTNPDVIDRPEFVDVIEAFYKADKWDARPDQAAEQPRSVVLESGGGAARQQRPNDPDWGDRIVKAAERLRPKI